MSCETKLLKENNELKNEVKYLSNKIERWTKSKVTLERIIKNQRSFDDMSGIGPTRAKSKARDGARRNIIGI